MAAVTFVVAQAQLQPLRRRVAAGGACRVAEDAVLIGENNLSSAALWNRYRRFEVAVHHTTEARRAIGCDRALCDSPIAPPAAVVIRCDEHVFLVILHESMGALILTPDVSTGRSGTHLIPLGGRPVTGRDLLAQSGRGVVRLAKVVLRPGESVAEATFEFDQVL